LAQKQVVEEIGKAMDRIAEEKGALSLAMLIPNEPETIGGKASLVISAPWLDSKSPKEALEVIKNFLQGALSGNSLSYISRIKVINTTDTFVKAINKAFEVQDSIVDIQDTQISGAYIKKAFLLISKDLSASNSTKPIK